MTCPKCGAGFDPVVSWQVYCHRRCRVSATRRSRSNAASSLEGAPAIREVASRPCLKCGNTIDNPLSWQKYCSTRCRSASNNPHRPRKPRKTRPKTPTKPSIRKEFGTLGPDREYIPPEGIHVRVISIPNTVHSDTVLQLLSEVEP